MSCAIIIELLLSSLPHSDQIRNIDLAPEQGAIRFDWRGTRYVVTDDLRVAEVKESMVYCTSATMLMEQGLRNADVVRKAILEAKK